MTSNLGRKDIPSTFGAVNREQSAYDLLLPYLRRESEDIELDVEEFLLEAGKDYPYPTMGHYSPGSIFIWIHIDPFPSEVVHSLRALAHEIGHDRTVGVCSTVDEEAQAKSVGRHLLRKWSRETN